MHGVSQGQWPRWPSKGQDAVSKIRCGHLLTLIMHNVSIPVNGSMLRRWKHDFPWKIGRKLYHYLRHNFVAWPGHFLTKSCAKDVPWAIQNFSAISWAVRPFQKKITGCIPHPPAPARDNVRKVNAKNLLQNQLHDSYKRIFVFWTISQEYK